jgi:hypothetical protein
MSRAVITARIIKPLFAIIPDINLLWQRGIQPLTHCTVQTAPHQRTEAEFLDKIQIKVLRVFLLAIHSHLYSFASRFLFLQTHATSYSFCKGERMKT